LFGSLQVLLGLRFGGEDGGNDKQGEEKGELKMSEQVVKTMFLAWLD